jgi:hypothetical protein
VATYSPGPLYYEGALLVLHDIGAPATQFTVNAIVAWEIHEWDGWLAVTNNPMATSYQGPGSLGHCRLPNGEMTSEPCYDTIEHGAAACAYTLLSNPTYAPLVVALRSSDEASFFGSAACQYALGVWANGYQKPNYGYQAELKRYYDSLPPVPAQYIGGGVITPPPPTHPPNPPSPKPPPPSPPPVVPGLSPWIVVGGGLIVLGLGAAGYALYETRRGV